MKPNFYVLNLRRLMDKDDNEIGVDIFVTLEDRNEIFDIVVCDAHLLNDNRMEYVEVISQEEFTSYDKVMEAYRFECKNLINYLD